MFQVPKVCFKTVILSFVLEPAVEPWWSSAGTLWSSVTAFRVLFECFKSLKTLEFIGGVLRFEKGFNAVNEVLETAWHFNCISHSLNEWSVCFLDKETHVGESCLLLPFTQNIDCSLFSNRWHKLKREALCFSFMCRLSVAPCNKVKPKFIYTAHLKNNLSDQSALQAKTKQ